MPDHWLDHVLIGVAFLATLGTFLTLAIVNGQPQPRLMDAVIALAGIIGGFASRGVVERRRARGEG